MTKKKSNKLKKLPWSNSVYARLALYDGVNPSADFGIGSLITLGIGYLGGFRTGRGMSEDEARWAAYLGLPYDKEYAPDTNIRFEYDKYYPDRQYLGVSKRAKDEIREEVIPEAKRIKDKYNKEWIQVLDERGIFGNDSTIYHPRETYTGDLGKFGIREVGDSGIYEIGDKYDFPSWIPVPDRNEGTELMIRDTIWSDRANPKLYNKEIIKRKNNKYSFGSWFNNAAGNLSNWNKGVTDKFMGSLIGLGLGKLGISSGGMGSMLNTAATAIGGLLAGKNLTGVGNAMLKIGSLASNIPGIGGIIGAGVNLVGGVVNAAFGSSLNEENIAQTEGLINQLFGFQSNAGDYDALASNYLSVPNMGYFSKDFIGSDGWFSDKAENKWNELRAEQARAENWIDRSLAGNARNIATTTLLNLEANYSADGGPINMLYSGVMSPFGNRFDIGGNLDTRSAKLAKLRSRFNKKGTYRGGNFGGAGASSVFIESPDDYTLVKDTIYLPYRETFNDAFRRARVTGLNEFMFDNKLYNTELGDNPDNYQAGQNRVVEGVIPVERTRKVKNKKSEGGPLEELVKLVNSKDKNFVKRLKDPNRKYIKDWESDNIATHKLSVATDEFGNHYIYPEVLEINGKLIDFTDPSYPPFTGAISAEERGDTVRVNSIEDGLLFTENYKKFYPKGKSFKKGGSLTHGGIFSNGVEYIGNGGTHELNPNEGVLMGVDPQGVPNLVEEGEVIWNDYVFSNRLKAPKAIRLKYKLRDNITFADAAKCMLKESEERPNDPISQDGLNALFSDLAMSLEEVRMKKEGNKFAKGGKLFDTGGPKKWSWGDSFKYLKDNKYDQGYLDFINNDLTLDMIDSALKTNPKLFSRFRAKNPNYTPTLKEVLNWATDYKPSDYHKFAEWLYDKNYNKLSYNPDELAYSPDNIGLAGITIGDRINADEMFGNLVTDLSDEDKAYILGQTDDPMKKEDKNGEKEIAPIKYSNLRYAPLIGSGLAVLNDWFGGNEPNYANADMFANAINSTNRQVRSRPIGNYLRYNPFDTNFYLNKLAANAAASRRAIANTAGGNRAAAIAGILGADYGAMEQFGNLSRLAEEYNLAQRQQVADFNRATNMFNAEQGTKVDMFNNEQAMNRAKMYGTLANMRQGLYEANRLEKANNLTNFLEGIGAVGKEMTDRDMIRWLIEKGVTKAAKGGKINRKKRGGFTV